MICGSSPVGTSYFSFLQDIQAGSGTHPASSAYRCSFPGIKQPGRDVNHTPYCSAEVNEWSYASSLPICLLGVGRD